MLNTHVVSGVGMADSEREDSAVGGVELVNTELVDTHVESTDANRKKGYKAYSCDQCEYTGAQLGHLKTHKESKHEGIRYPCDQCEYTSTQPSNLKRHKESIHKGTRYSCDQCEFTGLKSALIHHKKTKHEGIKYPCDQCNFTTSHLGNLNQHVESKHFGIRYPCDQCELK